MSPWRNNCKMTGQHSYEEPIMPTTLDIFHDYTCEDSYALSQRLLAVRPQQPGLVLRWRAFLLEWQNGATHGVPALAAMRAAYAARRQGEDAFYRFHPLLFDAYHVAGRNISDPNVLRTVAAAAGLDVPRLAADASLTGGAPAPGLDDEIAADFQEGSENYVFGTP